MFGSIGTFKATDNKFSNHTGNQYNNNACLSGPTAGQIYSPFAERNSSRVTPATPMFKEITSFIATLNTFENNVGDQYNYGSSHSAVNSSSSALAPIPQPPIAPIPAIQSTSSPNAQPTPASEAPHSSEATMFGRIDNFEADKNVFTNTVGDQINVHRGKGIAVPAPRLPAPPTLGSTTVTSPDEAEHRSNATYTTLEVTNSVVTALHSAARLCPVPFLAQAAETVLAIFQGVQGLRDNKDALTGLANHSCNLINSVVLVQQNFQRDGRELAPGMVSNLEDFVKKLLPVKDFVIKQNSRHVLKRFAMHKTDAAKVAWAREQMTEALAEFGLRSQLSIQEGVGQIDRRLDDLVEALVQSAHLNSSYFSESVNFPLGREPPPYHS